MPELGEIKKGTEVGYHTPVKMIWHACINCGQGKWRPLVPNKNRRFTGLCHKCNLKVQDRTNRGGWGKSGVKGKFTSPRGYWVIKLDPEDFFYPSTNKKGEILEHRLVVAGALGRNLHRWELVHHKGTKYPKGSLEDKQDNRYPENLQLVSEDRHNQITLLERRIKYLEKLLSKNGVGF